MTRLNWFLEIDLFDHFNVCKQMADVWLNWKSAINKKNSDLEASTQNDSN